MAWITVDKGTRKGKLITSSRKLLCFEACLQVGVTQNKFQDLSATYLHHNTSEHLAEIQEKKMKTQVQFGLMGWLSFLILISVVCGMVVAVEAKPEPCKPRGRIRGKQAPEGQCDPSVDDCCQANKFYTVYKCSPPVSKRTKAILTINDFQKGGDGGGPSECDNKFHSNEKPVVALSTGWFNGMKRCHKNITIFGNGRSVQAMVVDECDSAKGCDSVHGFQPPCPNNIVDASAAVWKSLKVQKENWGLMEIFWSDD